MNDIQISIDEIYFYLLLHEKRITELLDWLAPDWTPFLDEPKWRLTFHLKYNEFMVRRYEHQLSILYDKLRLQEKEEETIDGWGYESFWEVYDWRDEAMH